MEKGDKVRFLNDVGGGIISGFQGNGIVLVRDESGFDIPVRSNEVVVIDTDDYNIRRKPKKTTATSEKETEPADKPLTFKAKPLERRGGESLQAWLAFLPSETEADMFEAYFVNDCNYYLRYHLLSHESAACTLLAEDEAAPNTKLFVTDVPRAELARWERISVQLLACKKEKSFRPQPAQDVRLRIDGSKFYKPKAFRENDFFDEPALLVEIVRSLR